ncbi:MAG: Dihydroneopterin aldolase [Candidatus Omnitrophica bacterium ADurb.Bin314]|jgi:dihydroneopterin aldolase|nr:MAG: Dihydroneopterin aldolase [Candidatus Omnitrophica bacterium ADurb.Bin314]
MAVPNNVILPAMDGKIFIQGLETNCIIGTLPGERRRKQKIVVDLGFPAPVKKPAKTDDLRDALNYKAIAERVASFVSGSRFYLIETLAERLAALLLKEFSLGSITLRVSKPKALGNARNVGVEIVRKSA